MRAHRFFGVAIAVAVALFASSSAAQWQAEPNLPVLDERISLELREASVRNVFESVERILASADPGTAPPVKIRLADEVTGELTICLRDVSLRTTLQAVCESLECRYEWASEDDRLVLSVLPIASGEPPLRKAIPLADLDAPMTLQLASPLDTTLRTIGKATGFKVLVDKSIGDSRVSLSVTNRPLREVLDQLCQKAGCRWELLEDDVLGFSAR